MESITETMPRYNCVLPILAHITDENPDKTWQNNFLWPTCCISLFHSLIGITPDYGN
jgi:hypothetical protein